MKTLPLSINTFTNLDSNGDGTVSAGPTGQGEVWTNITVSVNCFTNNKEAICKIYVGGAATPQFFIDGTTWGSTGDSSNNMPPTVPVGQQVFASWTGGDNGTQAFLNITGTRNVA